MLPCCIVTTSWYAAWNSSLSSEARAHEKRGAGASIPSATPFVYSTRGWIGGAIGQTPRDELPLFGPALLPQAGVAVGTALIAAQELPQWGETIMALTIGVTVLFELVGPPATLWAIRRSGPDD